MKVGEFMGREKEKETKCGPSDPDGGKAYEIRCQESKMKDANCEGTSQYLPEFFVWGFKMFQDTCKVNNRREKLHFTPSIIALCQI